jgi:hypothetical protein
MAIAISLHLHHHDRPIMGDDGITRLLVLRLHQATDLNKNNNSIGVLPLEDIAKTHDSHPHYDMLSCLHTQSYYIHLHLPVYVSAFCSHHPEWHHHTTTTLPPLELLRMTKDYWKHLNVYSVSLHYLLTLALLMQHSNNSSNGENAVQKRLVRMSSKARLQTWIEHDPQLAAWFTAAERAWMLNELASWRSLHARPLYAASSTSA